jgi:hypothetical protein
MEMGCLDEIWNEQLTKLKEFVEINKENTILA